MCGTTTSAAAVAAEMYCVQCVNNSLCVCTIENGVSCCAVCVVCCVERSAVCLCHWSFHCYHVISIQQSVCVCVLLKYPCTGTPALHIRQCADRFTSRRVENVKDVRMTGNKNAQRKKFQVNHRRVCVYELNTKNKIKKLPEFYALLVLVLVLVFVLVLDSCAEHKENVQWHKIRTAFNALQNQWCRVICIVANHFSPNGIFSHRFFLFRLFFLFSFLLPC